MPKYYVLRMDEPGTPPYMYLGQPMVFHDGAEAAAWARENGKYLGVKLCAKIQNDPAWKEREQAKYDSGEYKLVPWYNKRFWSSDAAYAVWKDHYPHPSTDKPGWLAYTKNAEDGAKDKQTAVRPGSYLTAYFKHVLDAHGESIERLVDEFNAIYGEVELKFAVTENDIIKTFENGPNTCMVGKYWPGNGKNPAQIYAAGDLQVAYLGDLKTGVKARTLVWPEKKIHSRVYGDIARITTALNRLGYRWGAPIGARLKRLPVKEVKFDPRRGAPSGCFIAPYIDKKNERGGGHLGVIDKGDHLIICEDGKPGSHHCGVPDGVSGIYVPAEHEYPTYTCKHCETAGHREVFSIYVDEQHDVAQESWCARCATHDSFECGHSNQRHSKKTVRSVRVGNVLWNTYYADMYAVTCAMTGGLYPEDKVLNIWFGDKQKLVSKDWVRGKGGAFSSDLSGRLYMNTEKVFIKSENATYVGGKDELKQHAFQCDGCGEYAVIDQRNQTLGNDQLFCNECDAEKKPASAKTPKLKPESSRHKKLMMRSLNKNRVSEYVIGFGPGEEIIEQHIRWEPIPAPRRR